MAQEEHTSAGHSHSTGLRIELWSGRSKSGFRLLMQKADTYAETGYDPAYNRDWRCHLQFVIVTKYVRIYYVGIRILKDSINVLREKALVRKVFGSSVQTAQGSLSMISCPLRGEHCTTFDRLRSNTPVAGHCPAQVSSTRGG